MAVVNLASRHVMFDNLVNEYIEGVEPTREEKLVALGAVDTGDATYLAMCEAGLYIIPETVKNVTFFKNGSESGFKEFRVFHGKMKLCTGKCDNYTYDVDIGGLKKGTYIDALSLAFITVKQDIPNDTVRQNYYWRNYISISYVQKTIDFYYDEDVGAIAYPTTTQIVRYIRIDGVKMIDKSTMKGDDEHTESWKNKISKVVSEEDFVDNASAFLDVMEELGADDDELEEATTIFSNFIKRVWRK